MRFQKRISLGPGVRLNLSKSGVGISTGVKGIRFSTGVRGSSLTLGIPGTGLSHRINLSNRTTTTSSSNSIKYDFSDVSISLDNSGTVHVENKDGQPLNDQELRRLKRTEGYKETIKSLNLDLFNKIEGEKQQFIEIFKDTPKIKDDIEWKIELDELLTQLSVKPYTEQKPTEERCRKELIQEANETVKSILFWTLKAKREEFVNSRFEGYYQKLIFDWEKRKLTFESSELARVKKVEQKKEQLMNEIIPGTENYVNTAIAEILENLTIPIDFSIEFTYSCDGLLHIDLDLPEIEDLPTKKANLLTSGKISMKKKTQKELKEEYATCVCGLAYYFAGNFFNVSPKIQQIIISGYTQRLDKKTGHENDEYVYSIKFNRELFEKLTVEKINPVLGFENFENRIDLKSNFEMKTIVPFS